MARTPVLFVPGICGSFNLGVLLDWRGPTLSGWDFPPFVDYGKNFVSSFVKAGYTRDLDLFVAFYDWRKSVKDSASMYLKPWIDRAKQRSGAKKVMLVGHSMGGLVSRSYIQSKAYADDVEELITVGTPHRGSAEAYYLWGGGEIKGDANMKTVFTVYMWYLRHAHPFQTDLSELKAIRTLVPSLRDLLPIDDYLLVQGMPVTPKPEDKMVERNLVGDLLNQPAGIETLCGRVPVTTIAGVGFATVKGITVAGPPAPPGSPAAFPDGAPISDHTDADGDGTVFRSSALIAHPQAQNTPPLPGVSHSALPDSPAVLARIFGELDVASPVLGAAPVPEPRLVIMTASPVTMTVEAPGGPPMQPEGVLGAAPEEGAARQRPRVVRGKDHGHSGKHLNIAVVPRPAAGTYKVQLTGTATGTFALGALLVSPEGVTVLGGGEGEAAPAEPKATAITTRYGKVVAGAQLFYEVSVQSLDTAPGVAIDAPRTTAGAVSKLRSAVGGGLLGAGAEGADPVDAVLGGVADPTTQVDALSVVAERVIGPDDPELAEAIIAQLQAVKE
ncbi:MAG: alpha/beta fold hydrolase [Chloroflexales bacterium]|nr:alpha/beta fold hydrolase [Chloroflexales bacterium]